MALVLVCHLKVFCRSLVKYLVLLLPPGKWAFYQPSCGRFSIFASDEDYFYLLSNLAITNGLDEVSNIAYLLAPEADDDIIWS